MITISRRTGYLLYALIAAAAAGIAALAVLACLILAGVPWASS